VVLSCVASLLCYFNSQYKKTIRYINCHSFSFMCKVFVLLGNNPTLQKSMSQSQSSDPILQTWQKLYHFYKCMARNVKYHTTLQVSNTNISISHNHKKPVNMQHALVCGKTESCQCFFETVATAHLVKFTDYSTHNLAIFHKPAYIVCRLIFATCLYLLPVSSTNSRLNCSSGHITRDHSTFMIVYYKRGEN